VWVHGRTGGALIGVGEFLRVGQRTQDADWSRRVNRGSDLGQRVFWSHGTAPDLRIVQEEQLVVTQIQTWIDQLNYHNVFKNSRIKDDSVARNYMLSNTLGDSLKRILTTTETCA